MCSSDLWHLLRDGWSVNDSSSVARRLRRSSRSQTTSVCGMTALPTVWVFGDQLNRDIGALAKATPSTHRVLLITATDKIESRPWHPARVSLITRAIEAFADELRHEGFVVDHRHAASMRDGVAAHRAEYSPSKIGRAHV